MAIRGKSLAIGILGITGLLVSAGMAAAVFPPLYQQPPVPGSPNFPVTPTTIDQPVIITGNPDPVDPPAAATPEPATLITGLMGLMLAGGYAWRKRRKQQSELLCG